MTERLTRRGFLKVSAISAASAASVAMGIEPPDSPESKDNVEIVFTGDIMLGRAVRIAAEERKDPSYPFRKIGWYLDSADLTFINLENPVLAGCPIQSGGMRLCADPEMVKGLIHAGVDVVTLANNHSGNYGEEGLKQTVEVLKSVGIESTGLGNLVVKKVGQTKFGFMGLEFVTKYDKPEDYDLVRKFKRQVDVLIVGVHWGSQYSPTPNYYQREQAKKLVAAGADTVVGNHPHWIQPKEYINGVPVYYALANTVFDQMWSTKTKEGLIVKQFYNKGKLIGDEEKRIFIRDVGQPEFVGE